MIRSSIASALLLVGLFVPPAEAYGPKGHATVGGIADQLLAGKPVTAKISKLLGKMKLADAALLPDQIKDWDFKDPLNDPNTFHLPEFPDIEKDLIAFVRANPASSKDSKVPSHHVFHFTDVPVAAGVTYSSGKTGRSQFDIVHMIPFCVDVLQGNLPEVNARKITKPVALILLAHLLGDIHQPLHVGAQYFDQNGKPVNPDIADSAFGDVGGNNLTLVLQQISDHGHPAANFKLHTYWDDETVLTAFDLVRKEIQGGKKGAQGMISQSDIIQQLAATEPAAWKLPAGTSVAKLAIAWADEILPLAREAHERLDFQDITINKKLGTARGFAEERPQQGGMSYKDFAGKAVRDELHKGGWRLAALLESIM